LVAGINFLGQIVVGADLSDNVLADFMQGLHNGVV
jgi:hypothetical protein